MYYFIISESFTGQSCARKINYLIYRQVGNAYMGLQSPGQRYKTNKQKCTGQIQLVAKIGFYN